MMMSQAALDWQMTGLFLLSLALLIFMMKVVAMLLPGGATPRNRFTFWLLPSATSLKRLRPVVAVAPVVLRAALLLVAVSFSYWVYWQLVRVFHLRPPFLSYYAAPILLMMMELLVAIATLILLPSGQLHPPLHDRPWVARSVAEFWGRRWNLWFSDWFRFVLFGRMRCAAVWAVVLVFAVSGLMHELVINLPLYCLTGRALFGSMMVYFLIQAFGILFQRRLFGRGFLGIVFTWIVVFGPVPLMINEGLLRVLHLWPQINGPLFR